ncbi:hypothetical protein [Kytococcus sedentarius]|uniref:hypothetical protein n=1 Tax=Kytococcus sedentarius TaxID=1276 RepID=UPI0019510496|nr:hypothetical protein [Kytococcus sedentarius]QRO87008.1 hypothetical protein I6J30_09215 [Kytococcus sedentarius]
MGNTAECTTASWARATFMLVIPYHLGWATHEIPTRPMVNEDLLEDAPHKERLRAQWQVERNRLPRDSSGRVSDWEPLNRFLADNPMPPGAPAVMMWDPTVLGASSGTTEHQHWYQPGSYFHARRVRDAVRPHRFSFWPADALTVKGHLFKDSPMLRLIATERWEYSSLGDEASRTADGSLGFAVLHMMLDAPDDLALQDASERLRRPRGGHRVDDVLHQMGLAVQFSPGAFSRLDAKYVAKIGAGQGTQAVPRFSTVYAPGDRWTGIGGRPWPTRSQRLNVGALTGETAFLRSIREDWEHATAEAPETARTANRTRVITVAEPAGPIEAPPSNLATLTEWSPAQAWTFQLAGGMNRRAYFRLPSNTPEAASQGTFTVDGSIGRATQDGVGVVIDPLLTENTCDQHDIASLRVLFHGRLLETTLLALRQRDWLDAHQESVAGLWTNEEDPDVTSTAEGRVRELLARESGLNGFHNTRWFTEVPGRPEATVLLRETQEALETPSLLEETRNELKDLLRIAELQKQVNDLKRQAAADDKRDTLESLLAVVAAVGLVLALAALVADPSWQLAGVSVAVALVLALIAPWAIRQILQRGEDEGQTRS